jgi:hypothetical protein
MEQIQKILREAQSQIKAGETYTAKVASTMLESTNVIGAGMDELGTTLGGYVAKPQTDASSLLDLFPKVFVESSSVVLVSETNDDGTLEVVNEGDIKPKIDGDFSSLQVPILKIAELITISDEMLGDIPFMTDAINRKLMRRLKDEIAERFFATIINTAGMTASNLTAGTGASKTLDTLPAIYQDMLTKFGYSPSLFMFNSPEYAKAFIETSNAINWVEIFEPMIAPNSEVIAGRILAVAPAEIPLYILEDMTIEIGKTGDDFINNMTSIRCEARVGYTLGVTNKMAVYNDTITATIAACQ